MEKVTQLFEHTDWLVYQSIVDGVVFYTFASEDRLLVFTTEDEIVIDEPLLKSDYQAIKRHFVLLGKPRSVSI